MKPKLGLIALIIFICGVGTLSAQSGRRLPDKGSNGTSGRTPQTSSEKQAGSSSSDEEGMINQDTYEGETVEGDVVRVNTSLVTVPVTVMDRSGKYIPDLGREDFHVFEEGV